MISWLVLGIIFLIVEVIHPHWVIFWFVIGAVVAAIISTQYPLQIQIIAFLLTSFILIIIGRPILIRFIVPKIHKTNIDSLIGRTEEVIEDIDSGKEKGAISVHGTHWNAKSENGEKIIKGSKVKIVHITDLTVIVKPVKKGE